MPTATAETHRLRINRHDDRAMLHTGARWELRFPLEGLPRGPFLRDFEGEWKGRLARAEADREHRPARPPAVAQGVREPVFAWVGNDRLLRFAEGASAATEEVVRVDSLRRPAVHVTRQGPTVAWVDAAGAVHTATRRRGQWNVAPLAGVPKAVGPLVSDAEPEGRRAVLAWVGEGRRLIVAVLEDGAVVSVAQSPAKVAGLPAVCASEVPLLAYRTPAGRVHVLALRDGRLAPARAASAPARAAGNPELLGGPAGWQLRFRGADGRRHVVRGAA